MQLPPEIARCSKLRFLALSRTAITQLPTELNGLESFDTVLFLESKLTSEQKVAMKKNFRKIEFIFE